MSCPGSLAIVDLPQPAEQLELIPATLADTGTLTAPLF